jgi:hypothetical protein
VVSEENIPYSGYTIVDQVVQPDQGPEHHKYAVHKPDGTKLGRAETMSKAKKMIDDEIAKSGSGNSSPAR